MCKNGLCEIAQFEIFDFIDRISDFPCDSCLFESMNGVCGHDDYDKWCVMGSEWKPRYKNDFVCLSFEEYMKKYNIERL